MNLRLFQKAFCIYGQIKGGGAANLAPTRCFMTSSNQNQKTLVCLTDGEINKKEIRSNRSETCLQKVIIMTLKQAFTKTIHGIIYHYKPNENKALWLR